MFVRAVKSRILRDNFVVFMQNLGNVASQYIICPTCTSKIWIMYIRLDYSIINSIKHSNGLYATLPLLDAAKVIPI